MVGVFLTSSGILLATDTAITRSATPGVTTFARKIEITGERSGAALTGTAGWETRQGAAADFRGVFRDVGAQLRRMKAVPVAVQLDQLVAALKHEAESKVFLGIEGAFPDGDVLSVLVVGYEGLQPIVDYAKLRIDHNTLRFRVNRGRVTLPYCWLLGGKPAAALALINDDPRLPDSLRRQPPVVVLQGFKSQCHGPLAEADARAFFLIAVEATVAHAAKFGVPDGIVGGDLDVLRITERGADPIERIRRPR